MASIMALATPSASGGDHRIAAREARDMGGRRHRAAWSPVADALCEARV